MPYDATAKFIASNFSGDIATWLLGYPIPLVHLEPQELSLEPIRVDGLMLLEAESLVLHIELQVNPKADIPLRLTDYYIRLRKRYPNKEIYQIVIYLKRSGSERVYQTIYESGPLRHQFRTIRIWEHPTQDFLRLPGLLPFATLAQTEDPVETLREVSNKIEQMADPIQQADVMATAGILAGLKLDKETINQILRRDVMRESSFYQMIEAESEARGEAKGEARGKVRGRIEEGRSLVLRQLHRRLGNVPPEMIGEIEGLSLERLEALGEALLDFSSTNDLHSWFQN